MSGIESVEVWRLGIGLVREVYTLTRKFPTEEKFGLTAQFRRAAVSVPSNVAEGRARGTRREYARFVSTARGSLSEAFTYLHIAIELGYVEAADTQTLFEEFDRLGRKLNRLHTSLTNPPNPEPRTPSHDRADR